MKQANSFVYRCSVAQCRKSNLFQVNSPPFLLNLVPQGQIFPELTIRHRDNSTNARKMIHINLPKSNKAEHFNRSDFFSLQIVQTHKLPYIKLKSQSS